MFDLINQQNDLNERLNAHVERLSSDVADVEQLRSWVYRAALALHAATVIGKRSCDDGDHMNYVNHNRLLREAEEAGWLPPLLQTVFRFTLEEDKTQ